MKTEIITFFQGISHISVGYAFLMAFIFFCILFVLVISLSDDSDDFAGGAMVLLFFLALISIIATVVTWVIEHLAIVR